MSTQVVALPGPCPKVICNPTKIWVCCLPEHGDDKHYMVVKP